MRELEFDGFWEGIVEYRCDNCGKVVKFRFENEEEAKNVSGQNNALRKKRGWKILDINGHHFDFCCDQCMIRYIKVKM